MGSLAASVVGLLGADSGLVWIVAGVFTIRALAGAPPGLAWGIACLGAGLRWGTLGVGDVETATRLLGATVMAGSPVVRIGMAAAAAGALADEARQGGLFATSWLERSAAVAATVALVPLFFAEGPTRLSASAVAWMLAAAGALVANVLLQPLVRRVPWWLPVSVVTVGVIAAEVVS